MSKNKIVAKKEKALRFFSKKLLRNLKKEIKAVYLFGSLAHGKPEKDGYTSLKNVADYLLQSEYDFLSKLQISRLKENRPLFSTILKFNKKNACLSLAALLHTEDYLLLEQ